MKQIIVISSEKERYATLFEKAGFHVVWSSIGVKDFQEVRDRSDCILIIVSNGDRRELEKLACYLKDVCIEEEKNVCLYGDMEGVDLMSDKIPSLYIVKKAYMKDVTINRLVVMLKAECGWIDNVQKKKMLFIDDSAEYFGKLRVYLQPYFELFASGKDSEEIHELMSQANIVVLNTSVSMRGIEFLKFYYEIKTRARLTNLKIYYLTETDEEQEFVNALSDFNTICFSKKSGIEEVADYLINALAVPQEATVNNFTAWSDESIFD